METAGSGLAPSRLTLAAFAGAVVIGGTNFVAVKVGNEELPPLFGAALRFAIAAAIFLVIVRVARLALPYGMAAIGAVLYGVAAFGIAYGCFYYALVGLSAGNMSVILAAAPLAALLLAALQGQERLTARGIAGGVMAIVGIALLSAGSLPADLRPTYVVAAIVGTIAVAASSVVVKAFPRSHPITTNMIGMASGSLLLGAASLVFGEQWVLPDAARTWVALGWLVAAGSVGLFALTLFVVIRWTASAATYVVTLMPVVAVTLGALLLGEELVWHTVVGGGIVVAATYVGALSRTGASAPAKERAGRVPSSFPQAADAESL